MRIVRAGPVLTVVLALLAPAAQAQGVAEPLTVYSSLPLKGASRTQGQAIERGARLALEEAGGVAGGHLIRYISRNAAPRRGLTWRPELVAANARRAGQDDTAIAYIGEFDSGASAISIPILNEVLLAQVSPANTAIGLTRGGPGADRGEPLKYYPAGRRSYFRIVPTDRISGGALAVAMRDRGCRRIAVLTDGEVYGAGLGAWVVRYAGRLGLRVALADRIRRRSRSYRALARRVRRRGTQCVAFTGITDNGAVRLFRDLARALPRAQLFGDEGVADSRFVDPDAGGLPPEIGSRVLLVLTAVAPQGLPEAGRAVLQRFATRYGEPFPDPYAVNGYEAMRLVLDAVAAVGADRRAVIGWLRGVRDRPSVLGTYSFNRFGDTTLKDNGLYRVAGGGLEWVGVVRSP